jgi:hypothetical protein
MERGGAWLRKPCGRKGRDDGSSHPKAAASRRTPKAQLPWRTFVVSTPSLRTHVIDSFNDSVG